MATTKLCEIFIADLVQASARVVRNKDKKTLKVDDILQAIAEDQYKWEFLNNAFSVPKH